MLITSRPTWSPIRRRPRLRSIRRALMVTWAAWLAAACAELLIVFYEVESVLATGPIIAALGLAGVGFARSGGYPALALLGLANFAVCMLFFGLVVAFDWSPAEATRPFGVMGFAYVIATLPVVRLLTRRAPRPAEAGECAQCGYLLFGLTEPRCPECGSPFDPDLFEALHGATGPRPE